MICRPLNAIFFPIAFILISSFGWVSMNSAYGLAKEEIPSFGYVPPTFPRDPVDVNEFYEHILLGQILEPLVESDRLGQTIPGAAERWEFKNNGTTVKFVLRKDIKFSNGQALTAADVKWTLERHLAGDSQSKNFLNGILSIKALDTKNLEIQLKEKNVGILKALSRDQLGILPKGWRFDPSSTEPITGSGPYRLIKENNDWVLIKNDRFRGASNVGIPKWELIYFLNPRYELPKDRFPDYIPYTSKTVKDALERIKSYPSESYVAREQMSYSQTSIWWSPHGRQFKSEGHKTIVMGVVRELVRMGIERKGLSAATGIIPMGIAGHMPEPVSLKPLDNSQRLPGDQPYIARVGARVGGFDFLFETDEAKALMAKHNMSIEFVGLAPAQMKSLAKEKFDVVMGGWAGGFPDPDGFVPVVTNILDADFFEYLGELAHLYRSARQEDNWTRRSTLFKELNERLVTSRRMVPGWRIPLYTILKTSLIEDTTDLRYTPRLKNIRLKQK